MEGRGGEKERKWEEGERGEVEKEVEMRKKEVGGGESRRGKEGGREGGRERERKKKRKGRKDVREGGRKGLVLCIANASIFRGHTFIV